MARRQADVTLVVACSLGLVLVILAFPSAEPARLVLALPFVLFFPGYALTAALFPRRGQIDLVERFPVLRERRAQLGGTLSGGEQQMLAIARALLARPRMLIMDEPSMGLSPLYVEKTFEIIQDLNRQGIAILLVEQNANMALAVAHRGYVLQTGRIVLADTAQNLVNHPMMRKAYLEL